MSHAAPETVVQLAGDGSQTWHQINLSDRSAGGALKAAVPDPHAHEVLLAEETRPRRVRFTGGDVIILRGVNFNPEAMPEDMVELAVWISPGLIVTGCRLEVRAIADALRRCEDGRGPETVAELFLDLVESLTERLREAVRLTESALEETEDKILEGADTRLGEELKGLRRRAISLRRHAEPQLEALEDLIEDPPEWLDRGRRHWLRELANTTERAVEALSATREHIGAVHDQLTMSVADRARRSSQLLAIIATIFLPLNLITGLLGANVGGIPLAKSPEGFWVMVGLTLLILILGLVVALRAKWLD